MGSTNNNTETGSKDGFETAVISNRVYGSVDPCPICSKLELNIDNFVIRNAGAQKSEPRKPTKSGYLLRSGFHDIHLGTLEAIGERESCNFCQLVVGAVKLYSRAEIAETKTICKVKWEIDGHEKIACGIHQHFANRTRRLRLSWIEGSGKETEVYLVFVAPSDPMRPNSDANAIGQRETNFLGRDIDSYKGKQALIKSWIDLCHVHHGEQCKDKIGSASQFADILNETFFGVVDVVDMQLKPLPRDSNGRPARFAALSYVWGTPVGEGPYTTKRKNISIHIQHGGLEAALSHLPLTIKDAINLVQRLGERYIWIDSLCIVQDSNQSWRLNAEAMHLIYGNAYFTICAADGIDANTGLIALQSRDNPGQLRATCAPGLTLLVSRPPESVIKDSIWNKRGWTFQERLLSRRCIIFAEGKVYFQCRSTGMSEDIHTEGKGTGWSLDSTNAPLRTLRELSRRSVWFYTRCILLYTERHLSKRADILAAFDGMIKLMENTMHAPFCFGLPTSHFDFALLWEPHTLVRRRVPEKETFGRDEFPSWSWCGWQGGTIGYDPATLEGCLLDVHGWLIKHTWICWYIRDGYGHLRPLWDRREMQQDQSSEAQWQGYVGQRAPEIFEPNLSDFSDTEPWKRKMRDNESDDRLYLHEGVQGRHNRHRARERAGIRVLEDAPSTELDLMRDTMIENGQALDIRVRDTVRIERDRLQDSRTSSEVLESIYIEPEYGYADVQRDPYGRPTSLRPDLKEKPQHKFSGILPDNPFGVSPPLQSPNRRVALPDNAVLQFWTKRTTLHILKRSETQSNPSELSRYDIADPAGDWCGSIMLDSGLMERFESNAFQFIAISDAKAFTLDECPVWTYYIPKEREESSWDLYFVLLVISNMEKLVWERAGLGKVFRAAFTVSIWDEIKLG